MKKCEASENAFPKKFSFIRHSLIRRQNWMYWTQNESTPKWRNICYARPTNSAEIRLFLDPLVYMYIYMYMHVCMRGCLCVYVCVYMCARACVHLTYCWNVYNKTSVTDTSIQRTVLYSLHMYICIFSSLKSRHLPMADNFHTPEVCAIQMLYCIHAG